MSLRYTSLLARASRALPTRGIRAYTTATPALPPNASNKPPPVQTINRFWKHSGVEETADGWVVKLDARSLKTPGGVPCVLPKEYALGALLVAGEWESGRVLRQHSLPLTSVVCRSLDMDQAERTQVTTQLLAFLDTDSILHFQEYPQHLVRLQDAHFTPTIRWMEEKYGVALVRGGSILGSRQTPETTEKIRSAIEALSALQFSILERATRLTKSLSLGLAIVSGDSAAKDAVEASMVEVTAQLKYWQEIEEGHTLERANLRYQLGGLRCLITPSQ